MQIPDFTKLRWQLNVALIGAAFSAISLIYNEKYIYYGFITFVFGIISHSYAAWFDFVYQENKKEVKSQIFLIIQSLFIVAWIVLLILVYFHFDKNYISIHLK